MCIFSLQGATGRQFLTMPDLLDMKDMALALLRPVPGLDNAACIAPKASQSV